MARRGERAQPPPDPGAAGRARVRVDGDVGGAHGGIIGTAKGHGSTAGSSSYHPPHACQRCRRRRVDVAAAAVRRPARGGHPGPDRRATLDGPAGPRLVSGGEARLTDIEGTPIDTHPDIVEELIAAAGGATLLLEGALSPEPLQAPADIAAREQLTSTPNPSAAMSQMVVGERSGRKARREEQLEEERRRQRDNPFIPVAFVAVDLIWLDDESICDVPLLERRRLLESGARGVASRPGRRLRQAADRRLARRLARGRLQPPRLQGREQPLRARARRTGTGRSRRSRSGSPAGARTSLAHPMRVRGDRPRTRDSRYRRVGPPVVG